MAVYLAVACAALEVAASVLIGVGVLVGRKKADRSHLDEKAAGKMRASV